MCRSLRTVRPLRALSLLTALVSLCLAPLGRASAGAYTYSTTGQRTVNAGILLLDDTVTSAANSNQYPAGQGADNKDPYVFYILNQRTDIKPFGWNIVNPLAPTSVTSDVYRRWNIRYTGTPNYELGQTLSPGMAAYWEVPLKTASSDDLAKFDVLLLNLEQIPTFTPADGEKIRRFVDGGGTLWIENTSNNGSTYAVEGLFTSLKLQFNGGTAGSATVPGFIHSPLISSPYLLSEAELNTLGDKHISGYIDNDGGSALPTDATGRLTLSTVVGNSVNGLPVIAAAQFGAGEIVVTNTGSSDAINEYVGGVNVGVGANSGPFCGTNLQIAPTADLKLVSDIIASTDSHLNEHQNSHQSGNDVGSLPSAAQTWNYPGTSQTDPSTGAVLYGHLAYAVYGGALHAFDINPAEDLDGNGDPDDGIKDYDNGAPYDEVWNEPVGPLASAPTIAFDKNNKAVVMFQKPGGAIQAYDADTGLSTNTFGAAPLAGSGSGRGTYTTQCAPAPTYYGGRIYAGGADGNLYVYDVATGTDQKYPVDPVATAAGGTIPPILTSPSVGIVPDEASGKITTNDIVALCVTQNGLFSVFTGSRGELLKETGSNTGTYNTKLLPFGGSELETAGALSYTLNTDNSRNLVGNPVAGTNTFTATGGLQLYGDYDVDFANTPTATNLTRTFVSATSQSLTVAGGYAGAVISTPALDRFGNIYYTVTDKTTGNSVLYSVHDAPTASHVYINWRFLLPKTTDPGLDADNTSYTALLGYQFVTTNGTATVPSAPVVDAQGNVYVLASKSGTTAILCFNGLGTVSAEATATVGQIGGVNNVSITQPVDASGTIDEFGGSPATLSGTQYTVTTAGHIEFTSFGTTANGTNGIHNAYPNLNEPYPVSVAFSIGGGNNGVSQSLSLRPLHTNLSWYTVLNTSATSGLTLVGNTLYFMEGVLNGTLYTSPSYLASVPTTPASITNKYADPTQNPSLLTLSDDTHAGLTTAVPSISNGSLIINGPGGVTAYTNQVTLVVDANRVLEMDSSGNAEWAVDSTSKTTLEGDTTPIYSSSGTASTGTGQYATTTLELNRPSSVTELTPNDYLVADTGNSRCVRFDRAGKVIWELTKFTDVFGKLKPGEPDTLNQPTGVQIRTETNAQNQTLVRYLISDTGNDRIVEVDDVYDQNFNIVTTNGVPEYHILNWVSHTHDVQGRDYRYQSASYYVSPISGRSYVVALVTNKRIAPYTYTLTGPQTYGSAATSFLAPANQDAAGGTIVLLDYDPTNHYGSAGFGTNNQADGFIATDPTSHNLIVVSTISAKLTSTNQFDLAGTLNNTGTFSTLYIRNPRYLKIVTKAQTTGGTTTSVRHYLLADDNGVWDLDGTSFQAQWGFTQADYQQVTTPINQDGVTGTLLASGVGTSTTQIPFARTNIPFVPTSIQLTGTDIVNATTTVGRYLITNTYSQGEAANNIGDFGNAYASSTTTTPTSVTAPGFGGEVFQIHAVDNGGTLQSMEIHENPGGTLTVPPPTNSVQEYTGHTISRPAGTNTSPLSQPTFAYLLQF